MNKTVKLLATTGVIGSCGGAYFVVQPLLSTNERMTIADFNKNGVWKAIFLTHKEDVNFKSVFSLTGSEDINTASVSIRDKCKQLVKDNYKELVKKWCVVPVPKTIETRLYLDEYELSSEEDYKSIWDSHKNNPLFESVITNGEFNSNIAANGDFSKVKSWCEETFKKPVNDADLKNSKALCLKGSVGFK
ncbi:hypothetical protein MHC_03885 [Mycoplasma haemocanis str. Illinois]|uniref:Lipoprotein n=1 Tax=Mycoplasma haemocanis (strain Illinois) TaxID=1111676 RepID=H6N7L5_MYCHN|nr:hypothetical protein [Mycoplasma haemocanis]AEW45637.1 hypothetical protein MHC_03885 [Mycoplasma haemocanis str. Illinois]